MSKNFDDEFTLLTSKILGCCFDVINELGAGYLENVYKNSLCIALKEEGLKVDVEKPFEVWFRGKIVGIYQPDLIVNNNVLIELKSCKTLSLEHKAQVINYLVGTGLPVGLLVNFANRTLEYKRLFNPRRSIAANPVGAYAPILPRS